MECRLRQNYLRLPTQTTWMITLTIPRPKLILILDVGYSISEGVIMEQPTQNNFDSFGTQ